MRQTANESVKQEVAADSRRATAVSDGCQTLCGRSRNRLGLAYNRSLLRHLLKSSHANQAPRVKRFQKLVGFI